MNLKLVVIVSQDQSDIFFANYLIKHLPVVGVIIENQLPERDRTPPYKKILRLLTNPYQFIARILNKIAEVWRRKYADYYQPVYAVNFGEEGRVLSPGPETEVIRTNGVNSINSQEYVDWLRKTQPDIIAVCGASLLHEDILAIPEYGILNLHGGLSQKYRGLFTTDWAVHNEEPEYIGATVHYVSKGIDDGQILYQGRPKIEPPDHPNSLYTKVVKLGVKMMVDAITELDRGKLHSEAPSRKGALYLGHMYDSRARSQTWKKVRQGVMLRYLDQKQERDAFVLSMMQNIHRDSS